MTGPIKEIEYELFPFVVSLDAAAREALLESREDGTLVFDGIPPVLAEVEQGSILVSSVAKNAPYGFLRIVREVEPSNGHLTLRTVGAPPQLAFRKLHLRASDQIASLTSPDNEWYFPTLQPSIKGSGKASEPIDFFLFNGDGDPSTKDDQVHVTGKLSGGLTYDIDIDTSWGKLDAISKVTDCVGKILSFGLGGNCELPEIKAYLHITPNAKADVRFEGAAFKSYEKEYPLATIIVSPGVIEIGPIAFVVLVDVTATIEGRASSRFDVGVSASVDVTTGLDYGSLSGVSFIPPKLNHHFAPEATDVTLSGYAKVSIGPKLSLMLYGVVGPYAELRANASVDADQKRTPCFDVHAGADVGVGFHLQLPGLGTLVDVGTSIPLVDESVATGSCKQPPNSSSYPPGAGPDADHYLNPTFDPWARQLEGVCSTIPHQTRDMAWIELERAIDGHWALAGSGMDTLTKVDDQGKLVWAKRYLDPAPADSSKPQALLIQRTLPTKGAGLLLTGHPYAVMEIGQGGGVRWAAKFEPSEKITETGPQGWLSDQRMFMSVADDGQGNAIIAGSYQPDQDTPSGIWLLHLGDQGVIESSRWFSNQQFLYPLQLVAVDDGVVVAGMDWDKKSNYRGLVLARIRLDGTVVWAKRFGSCGGSGYPGMQPTDARRLVNGDILVTGLLGLGQRSFMMEVKPEGQVTWATALSADDPLSELAIHSVRELPTTGFLAAGRYHHHYDPYRVFLAGLDAKGRTLWLKSYGQPSQESGLPAKQVFPSIQLTDDGAALLAAYSTAPIPSENRNVWMFKAAAVDGAVAFRPGEAEVLEFPHASVECDLTPEAVSLTVSDLDLAPASFVPSIENRNISVESLDP